MAGQPHDEGQDRGQGTTGTALKRRGLMAGAAALVAGIALRQTAMPVAATTGGSQGTALILGANSFNGTNNTETQTTIISNGGATTSSFSSDDAFVALSPGGTGVTGKSAGSGVGVVGSVFPSTANSRGVIGSGGSGIGVVGYTEDGTGVYGVTNSGSISKGVYGTTASGYAVYGEGTAAGGYGVTGNATSSYAVLGRSGTGTGVQGESTITGVAGIQTAGTGGGNGVFGGANSPGAYGIVGVNYAPGGTALLGYLDGPAHGSIAFAGTASPGNYAAYFNGTVVVNGQLVVSNPSYKSGELKHSGDGSDRLVYCMESPESWIEDFGKARLVNGKAAVKLDPDFAAVVQTGDYHVFLTPYDGVGGLRAARQTTSGFAVEEIGGASSGTFSYRVVAKPKVGAGVTLNRLEKFTMPKGPTVDPSTFPKAAADLPTPPTSPVSTQPPSPAPAPRPAATSAAPAAAPAVVPAASATAPPAKVDVPAPAPPSR